MSIFSPLFPPTLIIYCLLTNAPTPHPHPPPTPPTHTRPVDMLFFTDGGRKKEAEDSWWKPFILIKQSLFIISKNSPVNVEGRARYSMETGTSCGNNHGAAVHLYSSRQRAFCLNVHQLTHRVNRTVVLLNIQWYNVQTCNINKNGFDPVKRQTESDSSIFTWCYFHFYICMERSELYIWMHGVSTLWKKMYSSLFEVCEGLWLHNSVWSTCSDILLHDMPHIQIGYSLDCRQACQL